MNKFLKINDLFSNCKTGDIPELKLYMRAITALLILVLIYYHQLTPI
jgi:hypothetical protein